MWTRRRTRLEQSVVWRETGFSALMEDCSRQRKKEGESVGNSPRSLQRLEGGWMRMFAVPRRVPSEAWGQVGGPPGGPAGRGFRACGMCWGRKEELLD